VCESLNLSVRSLIRPECSRLTSLRVGGHLVGRETWRGKVLIRKGCEQKLRHPKHSCVGRALVYCTESLSTIHDIIVRHINNASSISLASLCVNLSYRCHWRKRRQSCIELKSHCCDRGVDAGQSADALLAGGGTYRAIGSAPSVQLTESALGHIGEVTEEVEEDEPKILTMG